MIEQYLPYIFIGLVLYGIFMHIKGGGNKDNNSSGKTSKPSQSVPPNDNKAEWCKLFYLVVCLLIDFIIFIIYKRFDNLQKDDLYHFFDTEYDEEVETYWN